MVTPTQSSRAIPPNTVFEVLRAMPRSAVDQYLSQFSGPQRHSLNALRETLHLVAPIATECISYGLPCMKLNDRAIAGFGGFRGHNSYFPHSGSVLERVSAIPVWCETSRGTLRFPVDRELSIALVRRLIRARLLDIEMRGR